MEVRMPADPASPPPPWMAPLIEFLVALVAALPGAYVRAKNEPRLTPSSFAARLADAVVCACLAIGVSAALKWAWPTLDSTRVLVGLSAAFGLLGTTALSSLLIRAVQNRTK